MNILVVDDSVTTRKFLLDILTRAGHNVTEADNGVNALIKIMNTEPDTIILDLLMPEMDGFEVLEKLNSNNIAIPVIVLTADIQEDAKEECFALGVKQFINKPFKPKDLLSAINNIK